MTDLEKAKELLASNSNTSVVINKNQIFCSKENGIRPILNFISEGNILEGALVADKIIGKAAALLLVYGKVKEVYAEVISEPAEMVFLNLRVPYTYGEKVKNISNRDNTDICPMEKTAIPIDNPEQAFLTFKNMLG